MKLEQMLKYIPTYNTVEIEENLHVVASGKYGRTDCDNDDVLQKYLRKTVGNINAVDTYTLRITVYDRG